MNVIPSFLRWLYGQLSNSGDAVLATVYSAQTGWRIYEAQSTRQRPATGLLPIWPNNPHYPLIRITVLAVPHQLANGSRRFSSTPELMIEAITDGEDIGAIEQLANKIDALFGERATGQNGDLVIWGSWCPSHDIRTDNATDNAFKRLGGKYHFYCFVNPA